MLVTLFADGGARGNPGLAGAGVAIFDSAGALLATLRRRIPWATNNQAEYAALIFGLQKALSIGANEIEIRLDSKLIVEQLAGRWRVKDPELRKAHAKARKLLEGFRSWQVRHIPREQNQLADSLANEAMDQCCDSQ